MADPTPTALAGVHLPPRFLLHAVDPSSATNAAWAWTESGSVVRVLRGQKMKTEQGVFDEVGAALQFPYYFGENWDAMDECITDLEWLPSGAGYVLVIADADQALIADEESLSILSSVLARAIEEWATPVERGEWWDRPAVAFSVVLQAAPANAGVCRQRWEAAGASVEALV